jgi:hypothetical protein
MRAHGPAICAIAIRPFGTPKRNRAWPSSRADVLQAFLDFLIAWRCRKRPKVDYLSQRETGLNGMALGRSALLPYVCFFKGAI